MNDPKRTVASGLQAMASKILKLVFIKKSEDKKKL